MTGRARELTKRATSAERGRGETAEVPANTVRVFVDALERLGYAVDPLLANAGVRTSDLRDPDGRVSCAALPAIFAGAMRVKAIKNLGARLASVTPIGAFPLVDYLAITSPSVGGALAQLSRYLRLTEAPYTLELKTDEDPIRALFSRPSNAFAVEFGVTLTLLHLANEVDGKLKVISASFSHLPEDAGEIEQLLGCPLTTNASWNGFQLSRETWDMPMSRRDPALLGVLEAHAAQIAAKVPDADSFARDVRRALSARMSKGEASIQNVARALATSTRSLQRRLAEVDLTFQQLLDDARRDAADVYLSDPALTVGEVAYLLGYAEPAAFHRAFRRWHNVTPQAFRKQHRKPPAVAQ